MQCSSASFLESPGDRGRVCRPPETADALYDPQTKIRSTEVIATQARPSVGIRLCATRTRQCGVHESMQKPHPTRASASRNEALPEQKRRADALAGGMHFLIASGDR